MPLLVLFGADAVKLGCPSTKAALMPVEKGGLNSSTRVFEYSATQRLPARSTATREGLLIPACELAGALEVKLACPSTSAALIPEENGGANCSTRLLPQSATQSSPALPAKTAVGPPIPLRVAAGAFELKSACPS